MTTRQRIDRSREVRLWIGQIVVPVVGIAMAFPEVREKVKERALATRDRVRNLINRKGES